MKPGYQEQILYILNKHHSIVTIELGDAVTDDILQLIDSATREARIDENKWFIEQALQAGVANPDVHSKITLDLVDVFKNRIIQLQDQSKQGEKS